MIKVLIIKEAENIKQLTVHGHAGYAESGYDIVCAGVSSVVIGTINAIDKLVSDVVFDLSYNEDETGHITYRSMKSTDEEQLLLNSIIVSLTAIKENYSEFIDIQTREVK